MSGRSAGIEKRETQGLLNACGGKGALSAVLRYLNPRECVTARAGRRADHPPDPPKNLEADEKTKPLLSGFGDVSNVERKKRGANGRKEARRYER